MNRRSASIVEHSGRSVGWLLQPAPFLGWLLQPVGHHYMPSCFSRSGGEIMLVLVLLVLLILILLLLLFP